MTSKLGFAARLWYYFRIGYGTYLTFLLGAVNTLIVVWYLAIREMPAIESVFGHFLQFAAVATILGVPLSVGIGWVHLKRTPLYASEMDIGVEANPYYYKSPPGYYQEVFFPVFKELLLAVKDKESLDSSARDRIDHILEKIDILIQGGYVGKPRRKVS
jgi:hypothetical protein